MNSQTFIEIAQFRGLPPLEMRRAYAPKTTGERTGLMKYAVCFGWLLLAFLVIGPSPAQAALVGHFKFDDNLNDETGNHNGTLRDPLETPLFAPGKAGDALQIDSTGASIECANPTNFDMGRNFSVCAWVNTTKGGEVLVVYKGPRANFAAKSRQFELYGGDGLGGNGIFFYTGDSGAIGTSFQSSHNITVNDGNWHHVAVTYSANTTPHFTLYMDGIAKVGTDPGGFFAPDFVMLADAADTNQVLRIGGRDEAGGYTTFIGMLDEVQFYNATLTTNEIAFLFNNPGQVILPPLVPVITQQPQPTQTVAEGATVTLSATAEARNPLNYQWRLNGDALPGASSPTLTLTNVTKAQAGAYTLVASNADGSATSDPAVLYVVGAGGQSELSVNMYAGITIVGLVGGTNRIEYVNALGDTNDWKALATIVLPSSPYLWFDIQSTNFQKRFYRTTLLP